MELKVEFKHIPVMLNEVIDALNIKLNGTYIDCTVGGGGNSYEIEKNITNGKLYCFEREGEAIATRKNRLKEFGDKVEFVKANFKDAPNIITENVVGILIDLGVSSHQIDEGERGFSFIHNGRLDMRMGQDEKIKTAYEIVKFSSEEERKAILFKYGEEEKFKRN